MMSSIAPSALSHVDCAPGAGAEGCITSIRRFWRTEPQCRAPARVSHPSRLVSRPRSRPTRRRSRSLLPHSPRRQWRVVSWADILLDVISGVESACGFSAPSPGAQSTWDNRWAIEDSISQCLFFSVWGRTGWALELFFVSARTIRGRRGGCEEWARSG